MKKVLLALTLAFSSQAFAMDYDTNAADYVVDYFSWCDGSKVVSHDPVGKLVERTDCAQQAQECKVFQRRLRTGTVYYGACVDTAK